MKPENRTIAKALIAFAWADGRIDQSEQEVVDGVLSGLDADVATRAELSEYAKEPRSLDDIEVDTLVGEQRELLLTNAAILVRADGEEAVSESELLMSLGERLGFSESETTRIVEASKDGALHLPRESLIPEPPTPPARRK